ncbi:uncharacterized mitochondrial protein AtMg00820-like [Rutidosis leptorrhynchoides]|uniref:uncharacterized mitochondrial protein AtMg00820-like n=1 Tax=Rutidosis leptorrhynchoides TaxID=125765 RepID=UPI003A998D1B
MPCSSQSSHPMVTRSQLGITKPVQRLNLNVSTISHIPTSYSLTFKDPHWHHAMTEEYNALTNNNTWTLVPRPSNMNIVRSMWLFKHKFNADGTFSRYKARLKFLYGLKRAPRAWFQRVTLNGLDFSTVGIPVTCSASGMFISQRKYTPEVLFNISHLLSERSLGIYKALFTLVQLYALSTADLVAYSDAD